MGGSKPKPEVKVGTILYLATRWRGTEEYEVVFMGKGHLVLREKKDKSKLYSAYELKVVTPSGTGRWAPAGRYSRDANYHLTREDAWAEHLRIEERELREEERRLEVSRRKLEERKALARRKEAKDAP